MEDRKRDALWSRIVTFAREELEGEKQGKSQKSSFSRQLWKSCGSMGIQGLPVPEQYGGRGYTASETALVLEALGYGCNNNGLLGALSAHLLSCVLPVWKFGSEEQRQYYLPSLCNGTWVAAHGATEPEAGSDIFGMRTIAKRVGDTYVLTGRKIYILNAPVADLFLVFARAENMEREITAFIVGKEAEGVQITREIDIMGMKGATMGELVFEGCTIPSKQRLGAEGKGQLLFQLSMGWERTLILATHLGTMRRVLEKCILYARKRQQFGQHIGKFQSVSNMIADMQVRTEAGAQMLYRAARYLDKGNPDLLAAATAKLYLSEAAVSTYTDAIRVHGALGYTHDVEFADDLQDGIGTLIFSGTSDVQRQIIARCLGL